MAGYIAVIKSRGEAWLEGISRKCGGVGTAFPEAPRKDLPMTHNDLDVFANFINNNNIIIASQQPPLLSRDLFCGTYLPHNYLHIDEIYLP